MTSADYALDGSYAPKSKRNPIELVAIGILAVVVVVAVVLSIVVLVKVNDASSSTTTTPGQNQLNIPTQPVISSNSPQYAAYLDAVKQLKMAINFSADPCNDFWGYACGSYPSNQQFSFAAVDVNNYVIQANQMIKSQYQAPNTPLPLKQTIWYYNACVAAQNNFSAITQGGTVVINSLNAYQKITNLPFPMLNQNTPQTDWPNAATLGTALGYLSGVAGVDTLISFLIDTNWQAPQQNSTPYYLYIDQNTLYYPNTYYQPGTWQLFQDNFIKEAKSIMSELASLTGVALDATTLDKDVMDIVNLELILARNFSTDDTTRRQYARGYNPTNAAQVQTMYPFINWAIYFKQLSSRADATVQKIVNSPDFTFSVIETNMISRLSQSLVPNNPYGLTSRQLINYLAYRLVSSNARFLPKASTYLNQGKLYRLPKKKAGFIRRPEPVDPDEFESKDLTKSEQTCVGETMASLQYTNARFFADALYSDNGVGIRESAGGVITSILSGFQSMIDQLSWMDEASKQSAYGKITKLVKNIAFPDFVLNDASLTEYFSSLSVTQTDDYVTMINKISDFNAILQWSYLSRTGNADRTDFSGPPGTANAWYQPELNSITFPMGILQPPYYHPQYPASINYGGLGVVAGHELTHGYDDQGVQWDGVGKLASWLSNSSKDGFQRLANCVINEYSGFCPLPTTYTPNCIKGEQTQGENIADNGGIHAAWRAYKTFIALNGPDPRLPDELLSYFTHDQLFFLAFGRVWCRQQSPGWFFSELLTDAHSPPEYRVLGTVQNFPAFQEAFNCPTGSKYAPGRGKYCNVWVLDNN